MTILLHKQSCCGCSACVQRCPKHCISFQEDTEGFLYPHVDASKCIDCGLCERVCPMLHQPVAERKPLAVYAAKNKNEGVRLASSSGGVFTALAEEIIREGGVVFGACFSADWEVVHDYTETVDGLARFRGSKYVQSRMGDSYMQTEAFLKAGRKVLFSGTPCQVAGLKAFLAKDYDNLYCCDFICHGVPSALMLEKYLQWLQQHTGRINHINFRDKRKGWYDSLRVVTKDDGKQKILRGDEDAYWVGFNNHDNNLQLSCYNCHYLGLNRNSDITIADFWGIGKDKPFGYKDDIEKGVSMVMANNQKGQNLIDLSKHRMETVERNVEEAIKSNQSILHSSPKPASRDSFYKDINSMTFDGMIKRHLTPSFKTKLVKIMREYVPFCIIKQIRMKNQH